MLRDPKGAETMAEATITTEEQQAEERLDAQWERAECTCPDWCERDHERD